MTFPLWNTPPSAFNGTPPDWIELYHMISPPRSCDSNLVRRHLIRPQQFEPYSLWKQAITKECCRNKINNKKPQRIHIYGRTEWIPGDLISISFFSPSICHFTQGRSIWYHGNSDLFASFCFILFCCAAVTRNISFQTKLLRKGSLSS